MGFVLGAMAGTITACGDEGPAEKSSRPAVFAYQDRSGFVVVADDRQLAQIDGEYFTASNWTADGTYTGVVRADWDAPEKHAIILVEVATGTRREMVCGCLGFVAVGGSTIAWVGADDRLYRADASNDQKPALVEVGLPAGFNPENVVAGSDGLLLVHALPSVEGPGPAGPEGQHGAVFAVPAGGVPVQASSFDPVYEPVSATVSGRRFAYGVISGQGDCAHWGSVTVFDAASATVTATDMYAVERTGPKDSEVAVEDLWWEADGSLRASLALVSCDGEGNKVVVPAAQWTLTGTIWAKVQTSAVRERPLPGGGRLALDRDGTLRLTTGAGSRIVTSGVRSITVPTAGPA
jgi:hypothetical protein